MAKQSLFKKNVLDIKDNKSWLHNVYVLYFIFIIALGNFYYLMASNSWFYMTLFVLIGFLTSFFSKNMVVILCITVAFTNVLKTAITGTREGFETEDEDPLKPKKDNITEDMTTDDDTEDSSETKKTTAPATKTTAPATKTTAPATSTKQAFTEFNKAIAKNDPSATTPSATTPSATKSADTVQGFTDGVYTTEEDMEYKKAYKEAEIITNQEKIMKSLNKYKPLLETINGITKNIAVFKSS